MIDTSISYLERAAQAPVSRFDNRPRAACSKCGGSGTYRFGMRAQYAGPCFACGGSGKGKLADQASIRNRERAAQRRAEASNSKLEQAKAWLDANPGRAQWLREASKRNFAFAQSLDEALHKYGELTENQIAALDRCYARDTERAAIRATEQAARTVDVAGAGMDKLTAMFTKALDAGLKRPALIIGEIKLKPAKPTGRNPGAIYVTMRGEYQGKIAGNSFIPVREADSSIAGRVAEIARDPMAAAVLSGKETGTCSCCGRELTDPVSIANGIGPICAEKFF